jgi:hypothetical protein
MTTNAMMANGKIRPAAKKYVYLAKATLWRYDITSICSILTISTSGLLFTRGLPFLYSKLNAHELALDALVVVNLPGADAQPVINGAIGDHEQVKRGPKDIRFRDTVLLSIGIQSAGHPRGQIKRETAPALGFLILLHCFSSKLKAARKGLYHGRATK